VILDVGVHKNISILAYQSDPCPVPSLSRGIIRDLISDCPARAFYNHPRLNPECVQEDPTLAMDIGTLCHSLLLEGMDIACVIRPEKYPAKNGNVPDGWTNPAIRDARDTARANGFIPMIPKDYDRCKAIVLAAQRQLRESELKIESLQKEGESELTYIWSEDGTYFRIRPDWIQHDRKIILDCKFTGTGASPEAFDRQVVSMAYDIQSSLYTRGVKAVEGVEPTFVFFVAEVNPPYLACLIALNPQYQDLGKQKVEMGIDIWRTHLLMNEWPGYSERIHWLEPKPYVLSAFEERRFSKQLEEQGDPTSKW
jgi:hypothetical protein